MSVDRLVDELWEKVPDVLPVDRYYDGWGGAAASEMREGLYMPVPHQWDGSLVWCRVMLAFACHDDGAPGLFESCLDGGADDRITPAVWCRAIGAA